MMYVPHQDHHLSSKPSGMTKSEERDFDDIRWRALMKTTFECMADVHQHLLMLFENLCWATPSKEDSVAPTKARTTHTRPPCAG